MYYSKEKIDNRPFMQRRYLMADKTFTMLYAVPMKTSRSENRKMTFTSTAVKKVFNVGAVTENFEEAVLSREILVAPDKEYQVYELSKTLSDKDLIKRLGKGREGFLTHLLRFLKNQRDGQRGYLLVDGGTNLFHLKENEEVHVTCRWDVERGYWILDAQKPGSQKWKPDIRIFTTAELPG